MAACEKAEDKSASANTPKFDIENCASASVTAPMHMSALGCIVSPNKAYVLVMQSAGVLQLSQVAGGLPGKVSWTSGNKPGAANLAAAELQEDGNLVIYEGQKPKWNSQSAGAMGRYSLSVTDQGNAVIKNAQDLPVWAARFDVRLCRNGIDAPAQLAVDGCIVSPSKTYAMLMQKSGGLDVVPLAADGAVGNPIWSSGSHLTGGVGAPPFLSLQSDGNLVIYVSGKATWNSQTNTVGKSAYHLDLSDAGELKLHRADGNVVWSSQSGKAKP